MTSNTARTVTGDKIKFEGEIIIPVSLNDITKKLKVFVLKNTENLFGSDWFQKFNLWDQPINTFCQKVECITAEAEKIKIELKGSFPEVFSAGLSKCTKIKAKFEQKENTRPIFRKKRNVPFTATEEINKELDQLVNMGISSKVEFSDKLLPKQNKLQKTTLAPKKRFNPGEKNYFKRYQNNTSCLEREIIKEPVTETPFERLQRRTTNRRRANRYYFRRVRFSSSSINTEKRRSGRNRKFTDPLMIDPKRKKY